MSQKLLEGFYVHNLSKMNVSIGDLGIYIRAKSVINLLDTQHYHFNFEQLMKSYETGSISRKRDKLLVKFEAPRKIEYKNLFDPNKIEISRVPMESKYEFKLEVEELKFEELEFVGPTDEQFAAEFSKIYEEEEKLVDKK